MLVVVPSAHTNVLLAAATQCCLLWCDFQPWLLLLLLAWLLSTSLHSSANTLELRQCE